MRVGSGASCLLQNKIWTQGRRPETEIWSELAKKHTHV